MSTPSDPPSSTSSGQTGVPPLTTLNKELLGKKTVAQVEAFTFPSFDGTRDRGVPDEARERSIQPRQARAIR